MSSSFSYRYILALGSNLGDRLENVTWALRQIQEFPKVQVQSYSPFQETKALLSEELLSQNYEAGPYLNGLVEIATDLTPWELYEQCRFWEDTLGHPRHQKWCNRHLDIDVLLWRYADENNFSDCTKLHYINEEKNFYLPHRELPKRDFLLELLKTLDQGLNV